MPEGFQAWNAAAELEIDITTRLGFVLDKVVVNSGNQSGSVTNANLANGTPFSFIIATTLAYNHPTISFSGTTMTWTSVGLGTFDGIIYYGTW